MTDTFSDLWASAAPSKQQKQQLPLKSLATANAAPTSRSNPDAFNFLASAGSSQPSSRPITPKQPTAPATLPSTNSSADAFGGLVSFGGATVRDNGLTIAERAARAERQRKEQAEREHVALKSQGDFWDQFDKQSASNGSLVRPSNGAAHLENSWDLDLISSAPEAAVTLPTVRPSKDLFDIDDEDLATFANAQPVLPSKDPSRSNTPGSFDFGDREDAEDDDDILGALGKPVKEVQRVPPTSSPKPPSPPSIVPPLHTYSPPPHVIGRIVEMGFSVQQARIALAATDNGTDVDAALEILIQNAGGPQREQDEGGEALAEAERKRRRRQDPSRATSSPNSPSAPPSQPQGQADKLLAQASTIGLSMFSRANAMWKEGREKVVKVYEERAGGETTRSTGRPRWMDDAPPVMKEDGEAERASEASAARKPPSQPRGRERASLFADEEPIYKSPARRRTPASASTHTSPPTSKAPSPSRPVIPPSPVPRPSIPLSTPTLASSATHKSTGTQHFKLGRYADADVAYTAALTPLPAAHLLRVPLLNNRALARIRTGDYKGAVLDTGEVVQIITGELGLRWSPARETDGGQGKELGVALGKALRRRAEAREGMEKWKDAQEDWERLSRAEWVTGGVRGEAVKGAGRCRRMLTAPAPTPAKRPAMRPKPVTDAHSRPSEALARVRDANKAQEAEDDARHELKDSVDARLEAWRGGKETNLRALIASLDTVLWPELRWQKVGMAELVSAGQVKVRYTKAISKVHPDKLGQSNITLEQRMIANGVFGTLNEAWNSSR